MERFFLFLSRIICVFFLIIELFSHPVWKIIENFIIQISRDIWSKKNKYISFLKNKNNTNNFAKKLELFFCGKKNSV